MVRTLEELRKTYPTDEFILIIGADNWLRFPQWKQSDEILRHHRLLVYPRPGYDIDASTLPHNVQLVQTPLFDISSTQIRQAIREGNYHGRGLTPKVWKETRQKQYYL
jgi:nicotinate-nucleotide adenylyltransferase